MTAPATTSELRESVGPLWSALVSHPFPAAIADGTLPPKRFRFYLTQNLLYLDDYARMLAAGALRSADSTVLGEFTDALINIVRVEVPQNRQMLAEVTGMAGAGPEKESVRAPATVAYSSWLLSIATMGDSRDISAALLPCAWSYGEIASGLAATVSDQTVGDHPVYAGWIGFFASTEYAEVVRTLRESFDRELAEMSEPARERTAETFRTGCRLEAQFWQQAWTGATWPDLESAEERA